MEILFLGIIVFLFLLAVFDLSVGVSNDAVNFLNSAIGSGAATFKRVLIVASIGVFIGAAMSNGMMEIARHGIFRPEHFSFYELVCIFMAVMVTDIILLDVFNSLGMPTSTTVSMVFELLGATFVVAIIKMAGGADLGLSQLLNTEKALSVILGIFLSVAIAFVFGTIVQFLSRMIFSFNYRSHLKWKIGIFGGICATAIIYFLVLKGAKDLSFMTPEVKGWIKSNMLMILGISFVGFTCLMQLLHVLKVNVLKVIVLMGTFALAMAFAGNDLVNFIGVPLSGLASFQDYIANGGGDPHSFMMGSLNGPASTPVYFLIGAGVIMVVSLATSKKARNVTRTEIGLSSQHAGEEMFGSSRIARRLVRWALSFAQWLHRSTPRKVRTWLDRRFDLDQSIIEDGASFDLVRGSVNLVLAGALIALGTSLKLPLSTTFVTFMVAMGTSLADRAWGRESAVFRITGVISVIGGWFVTAGVAFIAAGIIVAIMHFGGYVVMLAIAVATIIFIIKSNRRFKKSKEENPGDVLFQTIISTEEPEEAWDLLLEYMTREQERYLGFVRTTYSAEVDAFIGDRPGRLRKTNSATQREKAMLKNVRRKETLCLSKVGREKAMEKNAWFYLANNCCMGMLYNLRRINEICLEHVDNNFRPLPQSKVEECAGVRDKVDSLLEEAIRVVTEADIDGVRRLRHRCEEVKGSISETYHTLHATLHEADQSSITVLYVYLNLLQESRELTSVLRKYLRAYAKLHDTDFRG